MLKDEVLMKDELDPEIKEVAYNHDYSRKDSQASEKSDENPQEKKENQLNMDDLRKELTDYNIKIK